MGLWPVKRKITANVHPNSPVLRGCSGKRQQAGSRRLWQFAGPDVPMAVMRRAGKWGRMIYDLGERRVELADGVFIAPNATLIGSVSVAEQASIWFNVTIRADNDLIVIGAQSNIQDGSVLHVDPGFPLHVGRQVTVGHKVILHGCSIGDGSLVGMNAVILNGARIGRGCLIGANTLVKEGMEVPDGSLVVGSPGKIVRQLDAAARQGLVDSALRYVENGRRFAGQLRQVTDTC